MSDVDQLPTITDYTIEGPAGRLSKRGLAHHDVQATAWSALGAVTAARWARLELRQRRAGVFELEGHNGPNDRSGVYLLTLGENSGRWTIPDASHKRRVPARRPAGDRASWADRVPGAQATLTRAEVVARVNAALDRPITAVAIAQWEREGILPIPSADPTTPSYPEAASQVVLTLISLQHSRRGYIDTLEVLRRAVDDLNTHADIATER